MNPPGDVDEDGTLQKADQESLFPELLNFASRTQALISELLLLSGRIPLEFRDHRYDPVLFDLRYFDSPDDFEARIEGSGELEVLEDQLRESCSVFMQRFFLFANGIVTYHQELLKYLNELMGGASLPSNLEGVLDNENGRQLLAESLALFGCLLLLLEHRMGGSLREKLLVAHVRYVRYFNAPNIEPMCLLCRVHPSPLGPPRQTHSPPWSSSIVSIQKPEDLLLRFPFPKQVVESVIVRLRDCDLYNMFHHYPDPEHRTVALASQAGWLYVLLFYSPEFLNNGFVMREIIDRFFKDSWVVPFFMYFTVDLSTSWDAYKGAKTSISSRLSSSFIRDLCQLHYSKVKDLTFELCSLLSDGVLTRDYVLNNSQSLLSLVRNCNISLRWLLLHRSSSDKKLRDIVTSAGTAHEMDEESIVFFFLKTSQIEFEVKQLYVELFDGNGTLWQESKNSASECVQEFFKYYSGSQALSWKIKDESLEDWLKNLPMEIFSVDYTKTGNASRKVYHMMFTSKEIEQNHEIKENLQTKQFLSRIQKHLQHMLEALNLHHDALLTFSVVTDAVYAWGFVQSFGNELWKKIEQDSSVVLNLHSFFLKFQSMLDAPLLRISQNHSPDLPSVSAYYSSEYLTHICAVLEIIPVMLFRTLDDVASTFQALQPFHLLNRIEKDKLKDFMRPDQQFHLTKAFGQISTFSQGILVASQTLHGLIDLDVKNWLESKIRKELLKRFDNRLKSFFLSSSVGFEDLEMNVQKMATYILSEFHLMEYFQDIIHIQWTHIWEEEFTAFLQDSAQKERDDYVPGNEFPSAQTFLGNLLHQILKLTNPSQSMYIEPMSGWFDAAGHELLGLRFFDLLETCVGPVGMACLDSLLTFIILNKLELALKVLKSLLDARCLEDLQTLDVALGPTSSLPLLGWSSYKQMAKFVDTSWEPWVESLACIGQLQLLRCLIALKLKSACKGIGKEKSEIEELLLRELSSQGMLCGYCTPLQTLYISEESPPFLSRCASLVTISQLPRYVLDTHLSTLTSRLKKVPLDFSPLVIGLGTFLRQFNPTYMVQYVQYMCQYIKIAAEAAFGGKDETPKHPVEPTPEVLKSAFWLLHFCKHMGLPEYLAHSCLPPLVAVLQA
ncbi:WASH complex subunit 5-like isoform X2 [Macadamia integrifolia]|uniref:WASH complex subunit 5-like isoform X2 n=1 Tax=Macadamia integrifolia TaxID=60698 RepID=UPI001C4E5B34|nr:WASH complex subunit 5-like isoform X2 [Macadamia integrifolia]